MCGTSCRCSQRITFSVWRLQAESCALSAQHITHHSTAPQLTAFLSVLSTPSFATRSRGCMFRMHAHSSMLLQLQVAPLRNSVAAASCNVLTQITRRVIGMHCIAFKVTRAQGWEGAQSSSKGPYCRSHGSGCRPCVRVSQRRSDYDPQPGGCKACTCPRALA
jgi:hypothetical protein